LVAVIPFLKAHKQFDGGKLCEFCRSVGLREPWHHNEWVGMPQVLRSHGMIAAVSKVAPTTSHTHIDSVTLWSSLIFDGSPLAQLALEI
jgi:hypothetical protein